ncbi:orofacial cleft 1 candidate gene 1 protein-like [Hipposideros larvatus]
MDEEKFQQKALKQTKQKKSKSAEFLMVKEDTEATEGIGNPAFNMSSPDLSTYQTSEKEVIRHDVLDCTLAAHQQKFRLLASAEPKGNEYSRNYFDPLMDEEINPRQCGMEVSREDERPQKEPVDSEEQMSSRKSLELHREDGEATSAYHEEFERYALKDTILLGGSSQQDLKFEAEEVNQYIPMSCLKADKTFEKYVS